MSISPSTAVVLAVAERLEREPEALPPLLDSVDPDALDALFDGRGNTDEADAREVRFDYAGLTISVSGSGQVTII